MRPLLGLVLLMAVSACAPVAPPSPSSASMAPAPTRVGVDCGTIEEALCRSVAEAAEKMTGTAPLAVISPPVSSAGGMPIDERYVVTLEPEQGTAPSFVEVVRFAGSDNWSARRLESGVAD
jgi:hypothetical protein